MTNEAKHSIDDEFARALEARHEQILNGKSDLFRSGNERVESAAEVLQLLGEYQKAHPGQEELQETNQFGDESTPGTEPVPEVAIYELESLGRFRILEAVGRGGFGVVFRAFDPELDRDVAVKVSRWDLAFSNENRTRFHREAMAAAGLNHPGIIAVHEVDSDRGLDFIVSEFVNGDSLAVLLAHGRRFSIRESVQIVNDVAEALEHAHQRGVLHRDLKPANILLPASTDVDRPTPKVSDFGLAAIQGQTDLTRSGAMVGTPEFMSPEQASGNTNQIGPETDVYALGGILYCLLAGRSPFAGKSLLNTLDAIRKSDPPPPSSWNRAVPRDLDAICLKCLEKQRGHRYPSARELQADLTRFLNGLPVTARRVSDVERCIRWCRRNPLSGLLSATLLIGLVIGLITVGLLWQASEINYREAERNRQKYVQKSEQLTTVVDRLFVGLANHPEIRQAPADGLRRTLLEEAHRFETAFLQESPDDPQLQLEFARSMKRLANIYAHLGDYHASLGLLKGAIDIARMQQPVRIENHELTDWWMARAGVETHLGKFHEAGLSYERATEINVKGESGSPDPHSRAWQRAQIQISQARSLLHQDKHQEAEAEAARARESLAAVEKSAMPVDHRRVEQFHWNRGVCRFILAQASRLEGQFDEAVSLYEQSLNDLAIATESSLNSDGLKYDQANCLLGLGLAWAEQDQPEQAVDFYRRSLLLLGELVRDHSQVERYRHLYSSVQYSLATNRMVSGDFAEFRQLIDDNIDEKERLVEDFPDARAKYFSQLGDSHNARYFGLSSEGKTDIDALHEILLKAKSAFEQALELNPEWNRPKMAICRVISNIGVANAKQNKLEPAIQCFRDAIERLRTILDEEPNWATAIDQYYATAANLIFVLQQVNDFDGALKVATALVDEYPDHRRAFSIRLEMAKLLARANRHDEAFGLLKTLCDRYAKSWQDYGQAADAAEQLTETIGSGSEYDEAFHLLAIEFLNAAMKTYPESQIEMLDWIRSRPRLEKMAEQLAR